MYDFEPAIVELAQLMANGQSQSTRAFDLRNELADMEYKMSEEELKLYNGLSSDLYQIEGNEILDPADESVYAWDVLLMGGNSKEVLLRRLEVLRWDTPKIKDLARAGCRSTFYRDLGMPIAGKAFGDYWDSLVQKEVAAKKIMHDFEKGLVELAILMANGQSECERADQIRDDMAELEYQMTSEDATFVRWLSSDLYMIEENEFLDPVDPEMNWQQEYATALYEENWKRILELLRYDVPHLLPIMRAKYRADAYRELGFEFAAKAFDDYVDKIVAQGKNAE